MDDFTIKIKLSATYVLKSRAFWKVGSPIIYYIVNVNHGIISLLTHGFSEASLLTVPFFSFFSDYNKTRNAC